MSQPIPQGLLPASDDVNVATATASAHPTPPKRRGRPPGRTGHPAKMRTLLAPTAEEAVEVRRLEERVRRAYAVLQALSPHLVTWRVLDTAVWPDANTQIANYVLIIRETAEKVHPSVVRCVESQSAGLGSSTLELCDQLCEFVFAYLANRRPSDEALAAARQLGGDIGVLAAAWLPVCYRPR